MDFKILETLILTCQNELDNTEGYPDALSALQDHLQNLFTTGVSTPEQELLLNWINLLIMDRKAADLYLEHWQLGEADYADLDTELDRKEAQHEDEMRQLTIRIQLKEWGYPDPYEIVFDNEGVPRIYFKNPNFDCTHYYESKFTEDNG